MKKLTVLTIAGFLAVVFSSCSPAGSCHYYPRWQQPQGRLSDVPLIPNDREVQIYHQGEERPKKEDYIAVTYLSVSHGDYNTLIKRMKKNAELLNLDAIFIAGSQTREHVYEAYDSRVRSYAVNEITAIGVVFKKHLKDIVGHPKAIEYHSFNPVTNTYDYVATYEMKDGKIINQEFGDNNFKSIHWKYSLDNLFYRKDNNWKYTGHSHHPTTRTLNLKNRKSMVCNFSYGKNMEVDTIRIDYITDTSTADEEESYEYENDVVTFSYLDGMLDKTHIKKNNGTAYEQQFYYDDKKHFLYAETFKLTGKGEKQPILKAVAVPYTEEDLAKWLQNH